MSTFAHLHVHSYYTLLGGTASVEALVARAVTDGLAHLALTDTNALYGVVAFSRACKAAGLQPIVGMAATVALPGPLRALVGDPDRPGYVVLLAMSQVGYRSLCRLSSLLQGHSDRTARLARGLSLDDLQLHREGLIALDGGRRGWTERLLRAGQWEAARQYAGRLAGTYDEGLYLSLELHQPADQAMVQEMTMLGRFLGVPTVAVQPVHCLSRHDRPRLKLLAAIDHNLRLDQVPAWALSDGGDAHVDLHWLSPAEMVERFAPFPDALSRVGEVIERCGPALPDGRPVFPVLDLPQGQSPEEALADQSHAGLRERYGPSLLSRGDERLEKELAAIARHGYAPLFLIVADLVRFAREGDIPLSTRGSVANSLVAYCTGITTVDPIANDLLFERFLSPARADPPDIDLDLCSRRRDEVLAYVRRKYGQDRVSLVATVSTMQLRSAIHETAKAHGLDEATIKPLLALLPHGWQHPDPRRRVKLPLEEMLNRVPAPLFKEVVRQAYEIEGLPHHLSVHPGGVVIAPGPLTDLLPVQWSSKGFLITQYDHRDVEAIGLPKLDLLGIRALTVLSDALALVRRDGNPSLRLEDIPQNDPAVAEVLSCGETVGVFQCESSGARSTLIKLRAKTVYDLAVANAFFKPGPALGGMAQAFVRRYRDEEQVNYLHPCLEPILGPTKGVLIFQEQILRIAVEVAGLSWAEADRIRRGVKFKAGEMEEMAARFVEGCQRQPPAGPGLGPDKAKMLWSQIAPFSGYGFNQGHAMAYAEVSYRSAYLKVHWPAAFMCARLANWGGFHHPAVYMAEAMRLGIALRGPHVNHSGRGFILTWEGDQATLWMGLGSVRDVRKGTARAIVLERRQGPFADLHDLMMRVPLQRKELEHLIQCGALDGLGMGDVSLSRAAMLLESREAQGGNGAVQLPLGFEWPEVEVESLAQRLEWERQLLGYPVSGLRRPLALVEDRLPEYISLRQLTRTGRRPVVVAGVRLPGWTGGRGFYLWDGETWVIVRGEQSLKAPPAWRPVWLRGHWASDEWGFSWFQAQEMREV